MAEFRNMLGSDEDSNEDIDHIPKTPGPPVVSDHESDEDKSGDEKEEEVKNNENDSDSESNSSSSQSDSSNDNNRNTRNDSEVERSDNENEDNEQMEDNRETVKPIDTNQPNDNMSSDDNEDNDHKNVINESQDNDSEDEDIVRRVSPKKKRQLEDNSDSSEDESSDRIKKQRIESNDIEENDDKSDDNEDNEDKNEEMVDKSAKATDIFGEMSSEDEDEDEDRPKDSRKDDDEKDSDRESGNENKDNQRKDVESGDEEGAGEQTFGDEEEPQEEPIPETRIEVEIPRIVADLGREVHFVKLPNFLSIDTHPYDPQWYEDEIDEDENLDDEGRARLKLKVENTIRWRNVVEKETNDLKKESNTRVVRWSDGSYSLHLGEEIFDIHKLQLMTGDNNHLFIRQGTGLQGQTVFRSKLNFRPFSTESFTHRKLTLSLADRSQKTQKIRVLPNVGKDPEAHRTEMIKKEEDRLKASIRREHKQKRMRENRLTRGPTASYLEPDGDEDEDEEGISLARIKNQYKRGSFNKSYDDPELSAEESKANDDDDSEDDLFDKKTEKRRATHIVESDDE